MNQLIIFIYCRTSLEEGAGGFARDAFGRQSMSEKRHATLDAKSTDTYQRNKKLREERERQKLLQDQQEDMNNRWRSEQLARERNLQGKISPSQSVFFLPDLV